MRRLVNARAIWIPGCGHADPPVSGHPRHHSPLSGFVSVTASSDEDDPWGRYCTECGANSHYECDCPCPVCGQDGWHDLYVAARPGWLRCRRYVYEEHGVPAAGRAAASVGYDLKGGQGGIGRIGDPAAVGRHLAQRS